jgi:hypothetical protein
MFTIHVMVAKRLNQINMPRLDAYIDGSTGMSASENGDSTPQRVPETLKSECNDRISGQVRPKSHYLKISGLLLDFGLS